MLKNNLLVIAATIALTLLILSIPSTVAYQAPAPKIEFIEIELESPLQVKLAIPTHKDSDRTQAILVKRTIASLESNGSLECEDTPGASGERGFFQYLPSTWDLYSLDVFGFIAEQTTENADYVTEEKIYRWLEAGYTPRDIFLIWNQGNAGPCKSGTNSHGVEYDSCSYADMGVSELLRLSK